MSQDTIMKIKTILHAENGKPLLTNEIHKQLCSKYDYKRSEETVRRNLKFMEKTMGVVQSVLHPTKKTNAWIYRENSDIETGLKSEQSSYKNDARINHSEYIKNNIIGAWLQQLPKKSDIIFLWSEDIFPVEKDEMFLDLKNHIKSEYGNPFDELDTFKQILHQFLSKKREIQSLNDNIFESIKNDYSDKNKMSWFWNLNAVTDFIIERVIRKRKIDFRSIVVDDFSSHVEEKNGAFLYYTMDYPDEMIYASFGELKLSKKKFKESMDKFVETVFENANNSERIQKEITALCELQEQLFDHIEKMRKSLKKHLALGILPGNCEYCL